jgi:4-amino-4-deoxy-L-arabinose transferase-like glycosyltransferase
MNGSNGTTVPRWAWFGLVLILICDVWYRCHTIGPTVYERTGVRFWPVVAGSTEPLDCDEAAYAYIGRRIVHGAVLYRDLTENKPPGGYWLYTLAVAIGGANELTIRLMPIPLVLATIALVWWIGLKLQGPAAGCLAALLYAILSTDPFLYGNGANFEHAINLFATASLALLIRALEHGGWRPACASGVCLAAACLVKQVAVLHLPIYAVTLILSKKAAHEQGRWRRTGLQMAALGSGFALVWALSSAVLVWQGAGREAFEDIVRYGGALATDTPAEPHAPGFLVRWITGNADPEGRLPPPFGRTRYLVWWGTGSWPLWLACGAGVMWLLCSRRSSASDRLVAAWTLSAWVQVAMPALFWQHYYLLPTPGVAVIVAVFMTRSIALGWSERNHAAALLRFATASLTFAAIAMTGWIQVSDYLEVPAEQLTVRYKGGGQWVVLRSLGGELRRRARIWQHPHIHVWGWQSPLFIYAGLDGVSPHFFVDPLLRAHANDNHPLIRPRVQRIMRDLEARRPEIIFTGYPPFPALRDFLLRNYLPSRLSPGLWIIREDFARFETAGSERRRAQRSESL